MPESKNLSYREAIKSAMQDYCGLQTRLNQTRRQAQGQLRKGLALLILSYLLLPTHPPAVLILALCLPGTWLFCQGLSASESLEEAERESLYAKISLVELMAGADPQARSTALSESLMVRANQRWLAEFLPGPIEVGRRPA